MTHIERNFLLQTETSRALYHRYAEDQPIYDYHCHLSPADIANDRQFNNLHEIWLEGDHYKWRAMRSNGVPETYCTGDAPAYDKFLAYARTVPYTLRNPLYHWSHLELKRYFNIDLPVNEANADAIWQETAEKLATPEFSARGILQKFKVSVVCTTDDPTDTLEHHRAIREAGIETKVYPAFRPDPAMRVDQPKDFNAWCDKLAAAANTDTGNFRGFVEALENRHHFFHEQGCRLSDHGLDRAFDDFCDDATASRIYDKVRAGQQPDELEYRQFATWVMIHTGRLDAAKGWVKQLHLGAQRNNNTRAFENLGRDTGFDSIGDEPQAKALARYLDALDKEKSLPPTILYNLNPRENYVFATMIGNFQDGTKPGKMQLGSGWWFLDQREGMTWQLNALSNLGLLSRFVGMLTDSRSFMSYPRHEYFRRLLCDILGGEMERGELPNDLEMVGQMVTDICYHNAVDYFDMAPGIAADS